MNSLEPLMAETLVRFGPFTFYRQQRLVCEGGVALSLGGRALEILSVLLEQPGQFVSKEHLLTRVWPSSVVEEINLRVHIAALRRALGDGRQGRRYIVNLPQRGYAFIAPVQRHGAEATPPHNLPTRLSPLIGRDELLGTLARRLSGQRLMTLSGPAGVGKSSLALGLAQKLLGRYPDGAWVVDLSTVSQPTQMLEQVALTLALPLEPSGSLGLLCEQLAGRRLLLILDGCEHLLPACRALVRAVLAAAPEVTLLLTSREALQLPGEWSQCLAPLAVPPLAALHSVHQALGYAAVQLFVSRARAGQQGFDLRPRDLLPLRDICRRLDGLPLALELAAAQVEALGIQGVHGQLESGLQVLNQGRRSAAERQRSLAGALDWSYERLSLPEQWLLQHLALDRLACTRQAVAASLAGSELEHADLERLLAQLAAKSLLQVASGPGPLRYRMLNTTRLYVLEQLRAPERLHGLRQRYAHYLGNGPWGSGGDLALQLIEQTADLD